MNTKCCICGAENGLHHYETDQCPRNGVEAPIGAIQYWENSVFTTIDDLKDEVARLNKKIKELEK